MRRILALLVLPALLFALNGCGNAQKAADKKVSDAKKKKKKPTPNNDAKPAATQTDKDKEWATKLMADGGRWKYKETDDEGNTTEGTVYYLPAGVLNDKDEDGEVTSGTWEVRDGYLIWSLGDVKTVDKIKEVTDKEFSYTDHDTQKTVIETKIKD